MTALDPKLLIAAFCHICDKSFIKDGIIVKDHNHFTGEMRSSAHISCNLNYRMGLVIPIIIRNLTGHNGNFIIKTLDKRGRITLLPIKNYNINLLSRILVKLLFRKVLFAMIILIPGKNVMKLNSDQLSISAINEITVNYLKRNTIMPLLFKHFYSKNLKKYLDLYLKLS